MALASEAGPVACEVRVVAVHDGISIIEVSSMDSDYLR